MRQSSTSVCSCFHRDSSVEHPAYACKKCLDVDGWTFSLCTNAHNAGLSPYRCPSPGLEAAAVMGATGMGTSGPTSAALPLFGGPACRLLPVADEGLGLGAGDEYVDSDDEVSSVVTGVVVRMLVGVREPWTAEPHR